MPSSGRSRMRSPRDHPYFHEPLTTYEAGLRLALFHDGSRTCVEERTSRNQMSASMPLFLTPDLPVFYIINTSGGLVQGDRLSVDITLKNNSRACVTTQSANKIYRMERNCAIQDNVIRLDSGAYLEFVPEPNIPYGGSRFFQSTSIYLKKGSTMFYWDIIYPGRYARGEEFAYDIYSSSLDIFIDEEPALADTVMIEPARSDPRMPGILGKGRFAANIYVYAPDYEAYINEIEASCGITASGILFMRLVTEDWRSLQRKLQKLMVSFRKIYGNDS